MDWTRLTDDPNDGDVKRQVLAHLLAMRRIETHRDLTAFMVDRAKDRRVLDVGIVSHAENYFAKSSWRHQHIQQSAAYCLGIDILADLIDKLKISGYNVAAVDATSDLDLGECFDVVFIGDTIEHVDNPTALLRFAGRHLSPGGVVFASTPNPFSRKFIKRMRRDGTSLVNLDHMAWITPTMAMEIGRRAGLELVHYHLIKKDPDNPFVRGMRRLARKIVPIELSFPDFLYEFRQIESR